MVLMLYFSTVVAVEMSNAFKCNLKVKFKGIYAGTSIQRRNENKSCMKMPKSSPPRYSTLVVEKIIHTYGQDSSHLALIT